MELELRHYPQKRPNGGTTKTVCYRYELFLVKHNSEVSIDTADDWDSFYVSVDNKRGEFITLKNKAYKLSDFLQVPVVEVQMRKEVVHTEKWVPVARG